MRTGQPTLLNLAVEILCFVNVHSDFEIGLLKDPYIEVNIFIYSNTETGEKFPFIWMAIG